MRQISNGDVPRMGWGYFMREIPFILENSNTLKHNVASTEVY